MGQIPRRLAAILAADVAGYSRLMSADEEATLDALKACRNAVDPIFEEHGGRIFGTAGDGFVAEFASAVGAVLCGMEIQEQVNKMADQAQPDRRLYLRIGINLGDVLVDGSDLMGDGVNIAARLEALAEPGSIYVARSARDQVEGKVDAGFVDLGEQALKNIATPVHVYRLKGIEPARQSQIPVQPERQKPSIAVLPIANISSNTDLDSFAAGLTEDLVSMLAEVTELDVSSTNTFASGSGDRSGDGQVFRPAGVGHTLEGKVQGSADRVRVTLQLSDGRSGKFLWAERFEKKSDDLFAVQDEIARMALIGIRSKLIDGDLARIVGNGTTSLTAWLRCSEAFEEWSKFTRENNHRAQELFQSVRELDRNWSRPLAGLAATYRESALRGWGSSRTEDLENAATMAELAIELGPDDPTGYSFYGQIQIDRGFVEEGIGHCEQAVKIAPGDFASHSSLAWSLPRQGKLEQSLATFARSRSMRPLPSGAVLANEAFVSHLAGRKERAIELLRQSQTRTDILDVPIRLVALFVDLGQLDKARELMGTVLARRPDATVEEYTQNLPFPDQKIRDWYKGLLLTAGLPQSRH